ncbi:MAG: UPF0175 family protein [Anaerolineae bacterium]|nr:UPF0175 family protein [Anaerolineae bacterium]
MNKISITFPENFELAVQTTAEELEAQIRLMAALKMFELGKLSSGKAAELAGLSRAEFFEMCGRYKVSIYNYDTDDVEAELKADLDTLEQAQK